MFPDVSIATPSGVLRPVNGSSTGALDPAGSFITLLASWSVTYTLPLVSTAIPQGTVRGPCGGLHVGGVGLVDHRVGGSAVHVAVRVGSRDGVIVGDRQGGLPQPERSEDSVLELLGQWAPAELLGDQTQQCVVGVAVFVGRVRREVRWMAERDGQYLP